MCQAYDAEYRWMTDGEQRKRPMRRPKLKREILLRWKKKLAAPSVEQKGSEKC